MPYRAIREIVRRSYQACFRGLFQFQTCMPAQHFGGAGP